MGSKPAPTNTDFEARGSSMATLRESQYTKGLEAITSRVLFLCFPGLPYILHFSPQPFFFFCSHQADLFFWPLSQCLQYFGDVASTAQKAKMVDHEVERLRAQSELAQKKLEIVQTEFGRLRKVLAEVQEENARFLDDQKHLKKCYDAVKVARDDMELAFGAKVKELQLSKDETAALADKLAVAQVELEDERRRNEEVSLELNKQGDKARKLEDALAQLKGSLPLRDEQVIEEFCNSEQPWLKITDSFVAGLLLCKFAALEDLGHLEDLTPELDKTVKERRSDAVAVFRYLKENTPRVLSKWESGVASPPPKEQTDGEQPLHKDDQDQPALGAQQFQAFPLLFLSYLYIFGFCLEGPIVRPS